MKLKIIYALVFLFTKSIAQQSLFNVPSISITKKKEVFFQEQANFLADGSNAINFNTAYGLGNEFEVGINLVGVGFNLAKEGPVFFSNSSNSDRQPYYPLFMLTSLKAFKLKENITLGVGAQVGLNPIQNNIKTRDIATLDYMNMRFDIPKKHLMICGGAYYSNTIYMGIKDQLGGLLGFEYSIIEHKLIIQGDWMIGKNSASVIVPGFVFVPHHNIALSFGWQFASPGTKNTQGLVFELTLCNF